MSCLHLSPCYFPAAQTTKACGCDMGHIRGKGAPVIVSDGTANFSGIGITGRCSPVPQPSSFASGLELGANTRPGRCGQPLRSEDKRVSAPSSRSLPSTTPRGTSLARVVCLGGWVDAGHPEESIASAGRLALRGGASQARLLAVRRRVDSTPGQPKANFVRSDAIL